MAYGALQGTANGHQWVTGSTFAVPANTGTCVVVAKITNDTRRQFLLRHSGSDLSFDFNGAASPKALSLARAGATYASADANAGSYAHYVAGDWLVIAFDWDTAAAARGWIGNLSTGAALAQPSAYTLQATIATPTTTQSALTCGGHSSVGTLYMEGPVACVCLFARVLSSDERGMFLRSRIPGSAYYIGRPGTNGTTDVPDVSGNGWTGTITGMSLADGPPRSGTMSVHATSRSTRRGERRGIA